MKKTGETCPKCGKEYNGIRLRTRHHVLPKRFFRGSHETIHICRRCHDELEVLIPVKELKPVKFYYEIVNKFLGYKFIEI